MPWNPDHADDPLRLGFPTLGYEVAAWIEAFCCHGPGDVQGDPVVLDREFIEHICFCYRLHPVTGGRAYDEVVLSRPKGRAKSELAGLVVVAEALADCTRFDGWNAYGQPIGRAVRSPLIKCLATEESQAGNTFENAAFIAGEWGKDAHPDIYGGVTGIRSYQSATAFYLPGNGEVRACTAGSASKDGGKETHVVPDESHLYVTRELKSMYETVARNMGKRKAASPWTHQTSTAYRPGEMSVFEETLTAWRKGELGPEIYVNHREAKGRIDLEDEEHTKAQLRYVYGAAAEWHDMDRKYRDMRNTRICPDVATAARYYLNRPMSTKDMWIDKEFLDAQARPGVTEVVAGGAVRERLPAGTEIAVGFDGSLSDDATVIIGSRMSDGFTFPIGIWAKPSGHEGNWWRVPRNEVLAEIRWALSWYVVSRAYMDPHEWRSDIETLGEENPERVIPWETRRDVQMAAALDRLHTGFKTAQICHSGNKVMVEHFGNTFVWMKGKHRLVRKEHPQSSRKIDSTVGAALAGEARADAIAAGWSNEPDDNTVLVFR